MKPYHHRGCPNRRWRKARKMWDRHQRYRFIQAVPATGADDPSMVQVTIQPVEGAVGYRFYRGGGPFPGPRQHGSTPP